MYFDAGRYINPEVLIHQTCFVFTMLFLDEREQCEEEHNFKGTIGQQQG